MSPTKDSGEGGNACLAEVKRKMYVVLYRLFIYGCKEIRILDEETKNFDGEQRFLSRKWFTADNAKQQKLV